MRLSRERFQRESERGPKKDVVDPDERVNVGRGLRVVPRGRARSLRIPLRSSPGKGHGLGEEAHHGELQGREALVRRSRPSSTARSVRRTGTRRGGRQTRRRQREPARHWNPGLDSIGRGTHQRNLRATRSGWAEWPTPRGIILGQFELALFRFFPQTSAIRGNTTTHRDTSKTGAEQENYAFPHVAGLRGSSLTTQGSAVRARHRPQREVAGRTAFSGTYLSNICRCSAGFSPRIVREPCGSERVREIDAGTAAL